MHRAEIKSDQDTVASTFGNIKGSNKPYEEKWFIDMCAPSYHRTEKGCNLCNTEKNPYPHIYTSSSSKSAQWINKYMSA